MSKDGHKIKQTFLQSIQSSAVFLAAFLTTLFSASILTPVDSSNADSNSDNSSDGTLTISVADKQLVIGVKPSKDGTFAKSSTTITTETTNSGGYTLALSDEDDTTNLANQNSDVSDTIQSLTESVSEDNFPDNSWGYSINNASGYSPIPKLSDPEKIKITNSSNSTADEVTVNLGVKVNSSITPGVYSDKLIFTATANVVSDYRIEYNSNGGYGEMETQTVDLGTTTKLSANTFYASHGLFAGWATSADGKVKYKDEEEITDIANGGETVTLYAVWSRYNSLWNGTKISSMQEMTAAVCNSVTTPDAFESDGETINADVPQIILEDTRDNKYYIVRKLADGNCWMSQNLDLDLSTNMTLTPGDSDVSEDWTPSINAQTESGIEWESPNTESYSYNPGNEILSNIDLSIEYPDSPIITTILPVHTPNTNP